MDTLLKICRYVDALNQRLGKVAAGLVLLACLVSAANAAVRYAFDTSSNAWLEIQWYMFGAMFLLGAAYTLYRNEHVRVDILYGRLSTRAQLWIDILGGALFLLPTCVIIAWLAWPLFWDSFLIREQSSNAGGLARWPIKFFLPFGFTLLALQGVSEIIKRIGALTGHYVLTHQYEKPLQ